MSVTTTWSQNLRALCSDDHYQHQHHHEQLLRAGVDVTSSSSMLSEQEPTKLQLQLMSMAASVRTKIGPLAPPSADELAFCSTFAQPPTNQARGFCNWLIPGHLMIGQYPGQNPLKDGPTADASTQHLERVVTKAKVSVFCSLQRETPSQDQDADWDQNGHVYLQPEAIRRQLPLPFTQYAPIVRDHCCQDPIFLHAPIEDLSVPECQEPLQRLLLQLLTLLGENRTIYIHCWGGRGRAGLVGACLLTLIWPHLHSSTVLNWVQLGYSTRAGHDRLAPEYASSPQTCPQRDYVRAFVEQYQALHKRQQQQLQESG